MISPFFCPISVLHSSFFFFAFLLLSVSICFSAYQSPVGTNSSFLLAHVYDEGMLWMVRFRFGALFRHPLERGIRSSMITVSTEVSKGYSGVHGITAYTRGRYLIVLISFDKLDICNIRRQIFEGK